MDPQAFDETRTAWIGWDRMYDEIYTETEATTKADCKRLIRERLYPPTGVIPVQYKITHTMKPVKW